MDIKLPLGSISAPTLTKLVTQPVALKTGQQFAGQVLDTNIENGHLVITLKAGNQTLSLQSPQYPGLALSPGQNIQLQVLRLSPEPEFKLVSQTNNSQAQTTSNTTTTLTTLLSEHTPHFRLTPTPSATSFPQTLAPSNLSGVNEQTVTGAQLATVKVIHVSSDKIQLQLLTENTGLAITPDKSNTANTKPVLINLDRTQLQQMLQNTGPNKISGSGEHQSMLSASQSVIRAGQLLTVEIPRSVLVGQIPNASYQAQSLNAQNLTGLIKQLLPRHESAPALLNQVINNIALILEHKQLTPALKAAVSALINHVPEQSRLHSGTELKQALANSGLLLEGKLADATAENQIIDLKPDLKANLLKLVHLLKQEINSKAELLSAENLTLLKNLQQKSENTLAKITLDQLQTLPREENHNQVWRFDIPFLQDNRADTISLQIQREANPDESEANPFNWTVQITLRPPGLDTIYCTVTFQNQVINTYFKSQALQTSELIQNHLDGLKNQLEAVGLKAGQLLSQQGIAPAKTADRVLAYRLFDEQA